MNNKKQEENKFKKGDKVILNPKFKDYSVDLLEINTKTLIVDKCFIRDFEDLSVEVLYLQGDNVKNPYLAEHFVKL